MIAIKVLPAVSRQKQIIYSWRADVNTLFEVFVWTKIGLIVRADQPSAKLSPTLRNFIIDERLGCSGMRPAMTTIVSPRLTNSLSIIA